MSIFTFKLISGGNSKYKKDTGPYHRLRLTDNIDPTQGVSGSIDSLVITGTRVSNEVIYAGDTVIILAADGSTTSTSVLSSGNLDATYDALNPLFPNANTGNGGTGGSTDITTKTDDTAAFAALSNGQGADFEVGGVISRYSKNAAGTTFKNYNQYP